MRRETKVMARFLIVGGSSTLLDYVIYWGLGLCINYNIAKTISMLCSCVYSFVLNKLFTFQDKRRVSGRHIFRYLISQAVNIGINVSINAVVYGMTGKRILGMLFATAGAMIVNYLLQRFFVFEITEGQEKTGGKCR